MICEQLKGKFSLNFDSDSSMQNIMTYTASFQCKSALHSPRGKKFSSALKPKLRNIDFPAADGTSSYLVGDNKNQLYGSRSYV